MRRSATGKLYYYCMAFFVQKSSPGEQSFGFASVSIGWPTKNLTNSKIEEARRGALGDDFANGALISATYLGHMTPAEATS